MMVFIVVEFEPVQQMRLPTFSYDRQIGGWQTSVTVYPGLWAVGFYWEDDPPSVHLSLPLVMLSFERNREYAGTGRNWCWFLLRFLIGKQELRLELDLHGWLVGIKMFVTNDWSIHLGPLDLECEYGKLYRNDEWPMKPTLRLFSKAEPKCDRIDVGTEPDD
jgi:hypothetical protein